MHIIDKIGVQHQILDQAKVRGEIWDSKETLTIYWSIRFYLVSQKQKSTHISRTFVNHKQYQTFNIMQSLCTRRQCIVEVS